MKPTQLKAALLIGLTYLTVAMAPAQAETVLIDWSDATDIGGLTNGYYWNTIGSNAASVDVPSTDLIGSATGLDSGFNVSVDITFNNTPQGRVGSAFGGNAINQTPGTDPFDEPGAVIDGIFANDNSVGTAVVTFTDLAPSTDYDFFMIGGRASNGSNGILDVLAGTSASSAYSLLNNGTLLSFSVTSTAGGVIEFRFSEGLGTGNGSTWNAMSITESLSLIQSFSSNLSSVPAGSQVTLSWSASGYDALVIEPGGIDAAALTTGGSGNTSVTVDETTTFTLTATQGAAVSSRSVQVEAEIEPPGGGATGRSLWTEWYRPVDSPVFSISDGNNHDPIIFYEPSGSTYKYYLIISHETSNAFLWGANSFSWDSADWTLINGNYQINGQYEYDDAVKVGGTYYLYEDGKVLTYTGDLADSNGNWTQAGTFPKAQCDDIGVFYEDGVFHIFGENGVYPDGFDGLRLSHYTSTTGVGNWTLVDTHAVDPNPDGGTTYGVGDATIAKVDGIYYLFCDRESVGSPYRVTAWSSTDLSQPFTYLGIAFEPREGEPDDWDNYRVQDADIQYIPELKRFIMVCNMMDTDGVNPDNVPPFLPNNATRVVGTFYSKVTDGGFDIFMEGFAGLTAPDALVDADPDGDGATNGEEYASGTLPDDPSSFPLYDHAIVEDGGVHYPVIVFDRITVDPLATRSGEVSNAGSLSTGAFSQTDGLESATGTSGAGAWYEEVIYRSNTPMSSSDSQFLRVRTTIAPLP